MTDIIANYNNTHSIHTPLPRLICEDGFSLSVQVGRLVYCTPRQDFEDLRMYTSMEVGFPSELDSLLLEYAEDPNNPTETVYGFVPVEVINEVIIKHGGLKRPLQALK